MIKEKSESIEKERGMVTAELKGGEGDDGSSRLENERDK